MVVRASRPLITWRDAACFMQAAGEDLPRGTAPIIRRALYYRWLAEVAPGVYLVTPAGWLVGERG